MQLAGTWGKAVDGRAAVRRRLRLDAWHAFLCGGVYVARARLQEVAVARPLDVAGARLQEEAGARPQDVVGTRLQEVAGALTSLAESVLHLSSGLGVCV